MQKHTKEIRSTGSYSDKNPGSVRLFVARWRNDGMPWPRELVEWLQSETGVPQSVMDDVAIRDDFSFVTCPQEDADKILEVFNAKEWVETEEEEIEDEDIEGNEKEETEEIAEEEVEEEEENRHEEESTNSREETKKNILT